MENFDVKGSEEIQAFLDKATTVNEENEQIKLQRYFQVNFNQGF